ncbi:hypothetical protein HRbin04_01357 [archaeon HR04]|nr:hypothetical protein HRbin04_01357 [archaeon HR04]
MSLGNPRVTFLSFIPAKWNVLRVICVPGSPIDCAATIPIASPGSALAFSKSSTTCLHTFSTPSLLSLTFINSCLSISTMLGLSMLAYPSTILPISSSLAFSFSPSSISACALTSLSMLTALPWSLFAGSMLSSPYTNCTILPNESLTV